MICVDAENKVAGRLASSVAKLILDGEQVSVFNAEKAVVMGRPEAVIAEYTAKRVRGDPYHGPFYPRRPDRVLKRIVRGMLPYKTQRGKQAFKRLKVFMSIPEGTGKTEFTELKGTGNRALRKSVTLKEIAERS